MIEKTPETIIREEELLIQKAIELITEKLAHLLDEPKPTLLHCIRVGTLLHERGYPLPTILGGYLHDTIEDSDVTISEIEELFWPETATIVAANTVDDSLPKTEKKQEVVKRCIETGIDATVVMAAEILDGLKYYHRAQNTEQLQNKITKANIFVEQITYNDPMFDELRDFIQSHTN